MPDIFAVMRDIQASRRDDPLRPVTVITPSHAAAVQLRRRLAALGPYASVRFEPLPRIAELLGAGYLAANGLSPLARPIGDYVAEAVALESRGPLTGVADLPGYARVLRELFRRLRRGGIRSSRDVGGTPPRGLLTEMLRLYDSFRARTAAFYDEEDLLDGAAQAIQSGRAGALSDLGDIYVMPPGPLTAAGTALLKAIADHAPRCQRLDEPSAAPDMRFLLAPDPASEAREVVREVLSLLSSGAGLHEVAVFHGADSSYRRLLREAFAVAGVPAVPLPGVPLIELPAGRGVYALARLPDTDYARTAVIDALSVAPVKRRIPGEDGQLVPTMTTSWDRISRDAGVTRRTDVWRERLRAYIRDREAALRSLGGQEDEIRRRIVEREAEEAGRLLSALTALVQRLEPLKESQPAGSFIESFTRIVDEYIEPSAEAVEEVRREIEQLGTVEAVEGSFDLSRFVQALQANLEAAIVRPRGLGDGIVIADYRLAAGMSFRHVVLCGAYEGVFPAGPGADVLVEDREWRWLKQQFPHIEDAETRIRHAEEAAQRAVASAGDGDVLWSAPRYEAGGTREYYPSPLMVRHFSEKAGRRVTGSELRVGRPVDGWHRRTESPMSAVLLGTPIDFSEVELRRAVLDKRAGRSPQPGHPRYRALRMLRARRSRRFTEWDGNVSGLGDALLRSLQGRVSPTSLEHYAGCGFRYFCRSILRLNAVEEPEEREVLDPLMRGSLIHRVLDRFYRDRRAEGRPSAGEPWTREDIDELMRILDEEMEEARTRGLTGLDIYSTHELRTIRADLRRFLEEDSLFRQETGGVPVEFEAEVPEVEVAGVKLRGFVDRIDRTPDGAKAWVIDYKTGGSREFREMAENPLVGGTKLQLPTYLAAVKDAREAVALYWFITQKGGFERVTYEPTAENEARFQRTIATIVEGVKSGAFPAVPGEEDEFYGRFTNCLYCDFDRICSRRRDFEFEAKSADPSMAPWFDVFQEAGPEEEEE
jgi:CRISPR/Cas system-associated exonuclease Cas4 (RecB family)